jgi:hypothetical protein
MVPDFELFLEMDGAASQTAKVFMMGWGGIDFIFPIIARRERLCSALVAIH